MKLSPTTYLETATETGRTGCDLNLELVLAKSRGLNDLYDSAVSFTRKCVNGYGEFRAFNERYELDVLREREAFDPSVREILESVEATWMAIFVVLHRTVIPTILKCGAAVPECLEAKRMYAELLSLELEDQQTELPEHLQQAADEALEEFARGECEGPDVGRYAG